MCFFLNSWLIKELIAQTIRIWGSAYSSELLVDLKRE